MKVPNCGLFSIIHIVCIFSPGKYSAGNGAPYVAVEVVSRQYRTRLRLVPY